MKDVIEKLGRVIYDSIWARADDVTESLVYLGDLYTNVPKHLKGVKITETTIHTIDPKYRLEVLSWLNRVS